MGLPDTLRWQHHALQLLDQRRLPQHIEYVDIKTLEQAWQAIHTLTVRGAPAIGMAAAFALAQSMRDVSAPEFAQTLTDNGEYLKTARPTAINLAWAIDQLIKAAAKSPSYECLVDTAEQIRSDDERTCLAIGAHGAALIKPHENVLTHCNAGSLAVSRYGTATAPMYHQHAAGIAFHVYVDETRPLYQGARLTAWELSQTGIDVTLICDNMAATLMSKDKIDVVIVGTDRVTANGDVVNKIGTLNLAVLCHHFGVPFYVACPASTYDPSTPHGDAVAIEERAADEVRQGHAAQVNVFNPAFDVTPSALVTGIITEHGVAANASALARLLTKASYPQIDAH